MNEEPNEVDAEKEPSSSDPSVKKEQAKEEFYYASAVSKKFEFCNKHYTGLITSNRRHLRSLRNLKSSGQVIPEFTDVHEEMMFWVNWYEIPPSSGGDNTTPQKRPETFIYCPYTDERLDKEIELATGFIEELEKCQTFIKAQARKFREIKSTAKFNISKAIRDRDANIKLQKEEEREMKQARKRRNEIEKANVPPTQDIKRSGSAEAILAPSASQKIQRQLTRSQNEGRGQPKQYRDQMANQMFGEETKSIVKNRPLLAALLQDQGSSGLSAVGVADQPPHQRHQHHRYSEPRQFAPHDMYGHRPQHSTNIRHGQMQPEDYPDNRGLSYQNRRGINERSDDDSQQHAQQDQRLFEYQRQHENILNPGLGNLMSGNDDDDQQLGPHDQMQPVDNRELFHQNRGDINEIGGGPQQHAQQNQRLFEHQPQHGNILNPELGNLMGGNDDDGQQRGLHDHVQLADNQELFYQNRDAMHGRDDGQRHISRASSNDILDDPIFRDLLGLERNETQQQHGQMQPGHLPNNQQIIQQNRGVIHERGDEYQFFGPPLGMNYAPPQQEQPIRLPNQRNTLYPNEHPDAFDNNQAMMRMNRREMMGQGPQNMGMGNQYGVDQMQNILENDPYAPGPSQPPQNSHMYPPHGPGQR